MLICIAATLSRSLGLIKWILCDKLTNPAASGGVSPVNARVNFIAANCGE
jgi:hypothetical protein